MSVTGEHLDRTRTALMARTATMTLSYRCLYHFLEQQRQDVDESSHVVDYNPNYSAGIGYGH